VQAVTAGNLVASGTPQQITRLARIPDREPYMSGRKKIPVRPHRRETNGKPSPFWAHTKNNLKHLDVTCPAR